MVGLCRPVAAQRLQFGHQRGAEELVLPDLAQQLFGDLEKERDKLNLDVENLRSFEREYRSRLKTYFTQQLEALQGTSETQAPNEDTPAPKRLRSILGDEES